MITFEWPVLPTQGHFSFMNRFLLSTSGNLKTTFPLSLIDIVAPNMEALFCSTSISENGTSKVFIQQHSPTYSVNSSCPQLGQNGFSIG